MLQFQVIGNLGADAELHVENGNEFLTFKVAHTERYSQGDNQVETTTWVSCVLNGRADKLRQYLTKGQKVFVCGDGSVRTYHSAKMQRLVAGCNLFVRQIELVGGRADDVPRQLFDGDGVQHQVGKYYYCDTAKGLTLQSRAGSMFTVDAAGWVHPSQTTEQGDAAATIAAAAADAGLVAQFTTDAPFTGVGYETVGDAEEKTATTKKTNTKKSK